MKFKALLSILSLTIAVAVQSCGGGGGAVDKDAKADFSLSSTDFKAKCSSNPGEFKDKIIEVKGKVTKTYEISSDGDQSRGNFYVELETGDEYKSTMTCFFGDKIEIKVGEEVTLKGKGFKYDISESCGIRDCVRM